VTYSKFHTPHRKSCDFTEIQPSCESEFIHSYPVRPRSTRAAGIWPWLCLPADIKAVRRFILSNQQTRLWNISVSNHCSLFPNRCAPTTSIKSKYVFKPRCGSGSRLEFWSRSSLKGFFLATRNPVNYPNILLFLYIYMYIIICACIHIQIHSGWISIIHDPRVIHYFPVTSWREVSKLQFINKMSVLLCIYYWNQLYNLYIYSTDIIY